MIDTWGHEQCDKAFQEANRILALWEAAPKRAKKKLWFAFQMAEERSKMMRVAIIEAGD